MGLASHQWDALQDGFSFKMDLFELAFIHCKVEETGHLKSPLYAFFRILDNEIIHKNQKGHYPNCYQSSYTDVEIILPFGIF